MERKKLDKKLVTIDELLIVDRLVYKGMIIYRISDDLFGDVAKNFVISIHQMLDEINYLNAYYYVIDTIDPVETLDEVCQDVADTFGVASPIVSVVDTVERNNLYNDMKSGDLFEVSTLDGRSFINNLIDARFERIDNTVFMDNQRKYNVIQYIDYGAAADEIVKGNLRYSIDTTIRVPSISKIARVITVGSKKEYFNDGSRFVLDDDNHYKSFSYDQINAFLRKGTMKIQKMINTVNYNDED